MPTSRLSKAQSGTSNKSSQERGSKKKMDMFDFFDNLEKGLMQDLYKEQYTQEFRLENQSRVNSWLYEEDYEKSRQEKIMKRRSTIKLLGVEPFRLNDICTNEDDFESESEKVSSDESVQESDG